MEQVTLSDGRRLAYATYGRPDGAAVVHHHGTPGSRLATFAEADLIEAGVHLIVADRPGFGGSDPCPLRSISGWAGDLGELADALGLGRFIVTGHSGGGAFALGAASGLGDRVSAVGVLAGAGELADPEVAALLPAPFDDYVRLARDHRDSFRDGVRAVAHPDALLDMLAGRATGPDADLYSDPAYMAEFRAGVVEAFAQGPEAYVEEFIALLSPWDVDLGRISSPTLFWYGDSDPNPLHQPDMGRRLAAQIAGSSFELVPGAGAELTRHASTTRILRTLVSASS